MDLWSVRVAVVVVLVQEAATCEETAAECAVTFTQPT